MFTPDRALPLVTATSILTPDRRHLLSSSGWAGRWESTTMTTRFFSHPYALMRPRRDGKPAKRILIDPYDQPLPLDQRALIARPDYHRDRVPHA